MEVQDKKAMLYHELVQGYIDKGYSLKKYGEVKENSGTYSLYKMVINPQYRTTLMITAGFHGDEANGPISLLEIIDKLAAYATKKKVRLVVYPCINPSGFDLRKHYNESNQFWNNDWMRYAVKWRKGVKWVGTLRKFDEAFSATKKVKSPAKEVCPLQKDIQKYYDYPVPNAVLDIHQQNGNLETGDIFAYIFERRPIYYHIMKRLEKIAPIAKNEKWKDMQSGRKIRYRIDEDGFVFVHDGTITDMFYRHGSKFVVTSETKTTMSLEQVCQVNLIWAKALINLISKK